MYLTADETQNVENLATEIGIDGTAEALVAQAMTAVLSGQADDVAYSVTDAAGVEWLTPTIWFRRRQSMDAQTARALLVQGRKDGTHERPIPDDEAKLIADAEELVAMAQTAWDQHVRGPEVEVLLRMAAEATNGDGPAEVEAEESPHAPEEVPPEPEPEQAPPIPAPGSPEADLLDVEPWEGYAEESVSTVISGINDALKEYAPEDFRDLMAHVWAFEQEHKNRSTVLDHLQNVANKLLQQPKPAPAPPPAPELTEPAPIEPTQSEPALAEPALDPAPPESAETPEPPAETPETPPEAPEASEAAETPETSEAPETPAPPTETEMPKLAPEDRVDLPSRQKRPPTEHDTEKDNDYVELIRLIDTQLAEERVHRPKAPTETVPDLPWDWTKMSDGDLQRFHGIFSVIAYYKAYVLAREERIALACKMAADELHNEIMVLLPKYDEHGKDKRVALIEAEVEDDEHIKKWRRRQRKHETFAAAHRYERDSVSRLVEALSRHETIRHDEWERAGKLSDRRR